VEVDFVQGEKEFLFYIKKQDLRKKAEKELEVSDKAGS